MTNTTHKGSPCSDWHHHCHWETTPKTRATNIGANAGNAWEKGRGLLGAALLFFVVTIFGLPAAAQTDTYDSAIAQARQSLQTGDYDTAIARANDALQARPGDKAAKDIMNRASVRKAMQGPAPAGQPAPMPQASSKPAPPPISSAKPAPAKAGYDSSIASARAALKREDYDEAEADANQALKARPKDAAAQSILVQVKKGRQERKEHDQAMAEAQKAMNARDYPRAVNLLTLVVEGWPNDVVAKDMLAAAKQGRPYTPRPAVAMQAPSPSLAYGTNGPRIGMKAPPKARKNEVSVSGDFFLGEGTVSLPLGYSLRAALGGSAASIPVGPVSVNRSSEYFGGTLSYSFGQIWYLDLSYLKGSSSGDQTINTQTLPGNFQSHFTIDDTWYQLYVRYTFPKLRGKRFSAYLRGGATYIDAKLTDSAFTPEGSYDQTDKTTEIQGNLGFGLSYRLWTLNRARFFLNVEGEGFYAHRSQKSTETLGADTGLEPTTAKISNNLYGGIGRATLRFEYTLGKQGVFRIFGDGGFQGRLMEITYPGAGTQQERLYGPYVKAGLRYSF